MTMILYFFWGHFIVHFKTLSSLSHASLRTMPSTPSRHVLIRSSFLQRVFEASQFIAQQSGFDANLLPIVGSLIAALILISLFITLLVWLRYMVMAGLITVCVVGGIRRKKKEGRWSISSDGHRVISQDEHSLEIEDLD